MRKNRTGRGTRMLAAAGLFWTALQASPSLGQDAPTTLPRTYPIEQITSGPRHHFYGYQGHAGNTPFNAGGTHVVLLETLFQDRYIQKTDAADIVLVDLATKGKTFLVQTRAWNFQQGTMMYWNPLKPDEEIFFNDRDSATDKVKTVLYNVRTRTRVKEWLFSSTPFANSGVAQKGGKFLGINYGRLDRLRPITGYAGAYDWTAPVKHPTNDGIWIVDVATGTPRLLLSFKQLRDRFVSEAPEIDNYELFINHTLWNRDDSRISASVRWIDSLSALRGISFTFKPDGTDLIRFTRDWGHADWESGNRKISGKAVILDTRTGATVETIDSTFFTMDGDLALARDLNWIASSESRKLSTTSSEGRVILYSRAAGSGIKLPWYPKGPYFWNWNGTGESFPQGRNRIDVSPCWNRNATKIYFFALAADGTRQAFVVNLGWGASAQPSASVTKPASDGTTVAAGSVVSFAGTAADPDTANVNVKWYIDRRGDGLAQVLLKDVNQAPGTTSGTVTMGGTRTSTSGETVSLGDVGASYTLRLVVSDGVNPAVQAERTFILGAATGLVVTINSVSTGKPYSLATASVGALTYIDRSYTIASLSATLNGQKMIRTANDDKAVTTPAHLKFTVSNSATVYVCYCGVATQAPAWLNDGTWTVTADTFTVTDSVSNPRRVYRKSVPAGQVTLGGNLAAPAGGPSGFSNYIVIVKP